MEPAHLFSGRFSLFETPGGGYHLAYTPDGDEEARHIEIPAAAVHAMKMAAEGGMTPMKLFSMLRGGK
jgi:hypothetical protein